MQGSSPPVIKDIVLIGGGHAHVTVLKRFGMKPIPGVRLTLISPDAQTPYSGMLPGLIAGHYSFDEAHIDLMPLCRFAGARFILGEVARVDPDAKLVHCDGRPPIPYDLLSINAGSFPDPKSVEGALGQVIPVKPVAQFLAAWQNLKQRVLAKPNARVGVVGAGAGGIELALSVRYALRRLLRKAEIGGSPKICIVSGESDVLATHNPQVRKTFRDIIDRRGIELHLNSFVERVGADGVHTANEAIKLDEVIWVTGANAPPLITRSGLASDERGFLEVGPTLRSTSHPEIFGAGDIASVVGHPRPKSGVFAVRQGAPLAANLRRAVLGQELREFRPQRAFLSLISTGGKHAVASRGDWTVAGSWVWQWKDGIDRRFMDKYNKLPDMSADAQRSVRKLPAALATAEVQQQLGDQDMRCGGCGAKVGAATLTSVLDGLDVAARPDVVAGLNSPDDAAITTVPAGRQVVQTIDAFRAMVDDPFVFGQIAANHCLGDIYAMAGEPQTAMAVATLPPGLPEKTATLLGDLMAGATSVLNAADCALVGGHTGEGAELSLGFAITGLADPDNVTRKAGLQEGDTLILTKPLGTGTIFAAEMRARAKGRWVQGAISTALHSNRDAVGVLQEFDVRACTDVTGFGLIGHLAEMLAVADVAAWLDPDKIAALDGALECISAGFVSSLQGENLRKRDIVSGIDLRMDDPAIQLMFDPQTAGGLLAGVPTSAATDCIIELRAAGYAQAATIGEVIAPTKDGAQIVLRPRTKMSPCSATQTP